MGALLTAFGVAVVPDFLLRFDFLFLKRLGDPLLEVMVTAITVYSLSALIHLRQRNLPRAWRHVTWWGGLRGAVLMALVLDLPASISGREEMVTVVTFMILTVACKPSQSRTP